jgi:glycosyltransferase involved in cell wall biosynthesis
MTVTVSTPDLRPSLIGVLEGLAETGSISRLITTLAFAQDGPVTRFANRRSPRLQALIRRRQIPPGLESYVECIPLGEVLRQFSGRAGFGDLVQHRVWMWAEPYFDDRVAERLDDRAQVLYGHEHACATSFDVQKRHGRLNALRQVNAHYQFLDAIQDEERDRYGSRDVSEWPAIVASRATVNARKQAEYELADLIVANSAFVRRTFLDAGVDARKVVVAPTGCPPALATCPRRDPAKRIVLCAGHLSFRKGTPYLLDAWQRLNVAPDRAELVLAGRNLLPERILAHIPSGVRRVGSLSAADLDRLYEQASVLVLPTLCEGLAHVIPEALSRGVPVITTPNSGAEGLVVDGDNGWLVPTRDADALADRLQWCFDHPDELQAMSERALDTAKARPRAAAVRTHVDIVRQLAPCVA